MDPKLQTANIPETRAQTTAASRRKGRCCAGQPTPYTLFEGLALSSLVYPIQASGLDRLRSEVPAPANAWPSGQASIASMDNTVLSEMWQSCTEPHKVFKPRLRDLIQLFTHKRIAPWVCPDRPKQKLSAPPRNLLLGFSRARHQLACPELRAGRTLCGI